MVLILADDVYEAQASADIIGLVVGAAKSGRHFILTENPSSPAYTTWVASLGDDLKRNIQEIFDFNFRYIATARPKRTARVTAANPAPNGRISFADAERLARHPFSIYVENSRNDRAFLLSVCTESQRENLRRLEQSGEVRFVHGGGITELGKQLDSDSANGTFCPASSFVIFDSDALMPRRLSGQADWLQKKCSALGVGHRCLERRAIENYITWSALRDWAYSRSGNRRSREYQVRTEAFLTFIRMHPDLRNHYNMKSGIDGDKNRADLPTGIDLYAGLTDADKASLSEGFGRELSIMYEFPAPEKELKSDGSWTELQLLISAVEDHL